MSKNLFAKKSRLVTWHIFGWCVLITMDVLSTLLYEGLFENIRSMMMDYIYSYMLYISFVYLNIEQLLPIILKKKVGLFIFLELVSCFTLISLNWWIDIRFISKFEFNIMFIFYYIDVFLFYFGISTAYKLIYERFKTDMIAKSTMQDEISFLRSQINPHFILNVLNNIIALSRTSKEPVEEPLLKLSSWIQYMLYNSGQSTVSLADEAAYIQSYVDLQAQRFKQLTVKSEIDINDDELKIEPMLLIPFVENAFKHGMGRFKYPEIEIKMHTVNNLLLFRVQNKYDKQQQSPGEYSGIGIKNVKKRLDLLYGNNYSLNINDADDLFIVDLQITLHD